jgi:hypothetical protein
MELLTIDVDEYIELANQTRFAAAARDLSEQPRAAADEHDEGYGSHQATDPPPQWAIGNRYAALATEEEEGESSEQQITPKRSNVSPTSNVSRFATLAEDKVSPHWAIGNRFTALTMEDEDEPANDQYDQLSDEESITDDLSEQATASTARLEPNEAETQDDAKRPELLQSTQDDNEVSIASSESTAEDDDESVGADSDTEPCATATNN